MVVAGKSSRASQVVQEFVIHSKSSLVFDYGPVTASNMLCQQRGGVCRNCNCKALASSCNVCVCIVCATNLVLGGGSEAGGNAVTSSRSYGRGSKPMAPFWGRCTTHFSPVWWGLGCSLGVRAFDPWRPLLLRIAKNLRAAVFAAQAAA